jgi:hypothetical protein
MNKTLVEILGWYGTAAILLAFALSSFGLLSPASTVYQLLNLTGALSIFADTMMKKDYQPATLNIVWAIIALISLLKTFFV